MTVLITGASGYLAHRLVPLVAREATVIGIARSPDKIVREAHAVALDITNRTAVLELVDSLKPDAIIHAAACNSGDRDDQMNAVNHLGTKHVAQAAAKSGARLVAISTDIVHNGQAAPYDDDAMPEPRNAYGTSKALGEQALSQYCPAAAIARTSLIYGLEQIDRGTASFITRLRAGETLSLFTNVIRQPVWVDSLAHALCILAIHKTDVCGTLNLVGEQAMSRAEFGLAMLKHWRTAIPTGQLRLVQADAESGIPLDCRMQIDRAQGLGLAMPGVAEVLKVISG